MHILDYLNKHMGGELQMSSEKHLSLKTLHPYMYFFLIQHEICWLNPLAAGNYLLINKLIAAATGCL